MRAVLIATFVSSCANYTVAPLCNSENAAYPPGLTGTYTFSIQDGETFEVEDQTVSINPNGKSVLLPNRLGKLAESVTCRVNDWYISESYDEEARIFDQVRVLVSNVGIHFAPLMYDRSELEDAGVRTKLVNEELRQLLGETLSKYVDEAAGLMMMIDNYGVPNATVVSTARTAPVGYHLIRK